METLIELSELSCVVWLMSKLFVVIIIFIIIVINCVTFSFQAIILLKKCAINFGTIV
jgi:hypothetical protein